MPQPTTILRDQRLAAIQKWLQENNWTPTAVDYDYAPAHQYARDVLGIPRRDRARQYVAKAARRLRGEYVNLHAGRPISKIKITIEEYKELLAAAKQKIPNESTDAK